MRRSLAGASALAWLICSPSTSDAQCTIRRVHADPPLLLGLNEPASNFSALNPLFLVGLPDGSLAIYAAATHRIVRVKPGGQTTLLAGNGSSSESGDGGPAVSAGIGYVTSMTADGSGNLYFATGIERIRRVDTNGVIDTVAGTGLRGFNGEEGPALSMHLTVSSLTPGPDGSIYFIDSWNARIRKLTKAGRIEWVAGSSDLTAFDVEGCQHATPG